MNVAEHLRKAYEWGPVLFGIGFIAPLVAQSVDAAPLGLSPLQLGLAVGISLGVVAKWRGSWV